jgi:FkbM family methyltransferase
MSNASVGRASSQRPLQAEQVCMRDGIIENDLDVWLKEHAADCLAMIGVARGQKVLDFGCGHGSYAIPAARLVGRTGRVYAMDKDAEALESLRCVACSQKLTRITTINTQGQVHVPLEEESVDVVLLHDVLHLIGWEESRGKTTRRSTATNRRVLLEEVYRVTKWDGLLSVFSPHLVTHTDITSQDELNREIESVGFHLEKELYHQLIHDGHLERGHLYAFRKRERSQTGPECFVYESASFRTGLEQDAHHHGEVTILEVMAEPGMVVLELGANRGVTTVALAKRVGPEGRVHAFEPVPDYYEALIENLRLNEVDNVTAHQLAVTDKESETSYYKHGEGSGIVQADNAEEIQVGTTSLDNFTAEHALERVDLINMDCEGAELLVLRGARKTLQHSALRIFCEIHHDYLSRLGQSVHDVVAFLHASGFQVTAVAVEALHGDVELERCTHICAARNGNLPDIKRIGRRWGTACC